MSVWVNCIMGHTLGGGVLDRIPEIVRTVSSGIAGALTWRPEPVFRSVAEEFEAHGAPMALYEEFSFRASAKLLILGHTDRWTRFLSNQESRNEFVRASKRAATMLEARQLVFVPEGTLLDDLYIDGQPFEQLVAFAAKNWGPPDLEISRIYSLEEVKAFSLERIHYFLWEPGKKRAWVSTRALRGERRSF